MLSSRGQDTVDTRWPRFVREQGGHDERMREAHLAPVNDTVSRAFDHRQPVVVGGAAVNTQTKQ